MPARENCSVRVLVTGYGGMSGTCIAHALAKAGHTVTALQRSHRDTSLSPAPETLKVIEGDICDTPSLPPVDAIVHAASTAPQAGGDAGAMIRDNVEATRRLIDFAREVEARQFLFFSSLSVYGQIDGPSVDEATPVHDPDPYGLSKGQAEALLAETAADLPSISLRLPAIVGPGALRKQNNWPTRTLRKILAGEEVTIFNPDAPFNSVVHLSDLAALINGLINLELGGFEAVTLGAGEAISRRAAVDALMAGAGKSVPVRPVGERKPSFTVSSDHAKARYGYAPMKTAALLEQFASEETKAAT